MKAQIDARGRAVETVRAPYQLMFKPLLKIASDAGDFRNELAKIPAGTALYEIWGKVDASEHAPVERIGVLRTTSDFKASAYEDEKLYFQHAGTTLKSGYVLRWLHGPK